MIITVFVRKNGAFHVTISADGNELKRKNIDFTRNSYAIHTLLQCERAFKMKNAIMPIFRI